MIETKASEPDETLRLKCPRCGGGLNLPRRCLGVRGHCVHCRVPLVARETPGGVETVADEPAAAVNAKLLAPLPTREGDDLFSGRPVALTAPVPEKAVEPSPFGEPTGFAPPSLFGGKDDSATVTLAWGTSIPWEDRSKTPFGAPPPKVAEAMEQGGGIAASLFREKAEKTGTDSAIQPDLLPSFGFGIAAPASTEPAPEPTAAGAAPATTVATAPGGTAIGGAPGGNVVKSAPPRSKRQMGPTGKLLVRLLAAACLVTFLGGSVVAFVPKERLADWKTRVLDWLEPGMVVLDYLPESLRPPKPSSSQRAM